MIRCRCDLRMLSLAVTILLISSLPAMAEEKAAAAPLLPPGAGETSRQWDLQAFVQHLPSATVHGAPGDVTLTDYRLKATRTVRITDDISMTLGGGYGLKQLDVTPEGALPHELHGLFLEAGARYRINDRSFVNLRAFPGFYGDFRTSAADSLRMPLLALGGYRFGNGISLIGGFIYRFGYHSAQFIPALGISYQPNEQWRLDLVAPRPSITWLPSRQLQLFVAGDFASDEYEIRDRVNGANAMKYSDYKGMGGVSYLPAPGVKISAAAGYAFDRRFMFFGGNRTDFRVDDVPFVRLSLDVGW